MFKDKSFRVRKLGDIIEDLEDARRVYARVGRVFLADGDALVLPEDDLSGILDRIKSLFPECERIGVYGSPQDVLRKGAGALKRLKDRGLGIVYIGAESGSERVLKNVKKGATAAEITEAIRIIESAGIPASVTFISGLAGRDGWEEHARETGRVISESAPSYVGLLTLMVDPAAPIYYDIKEGRFAPLTAEEVVDETLLLLEHTHIPQGRICVFRSNHASNYLSLKGDLPRDKARMLAKLREARGRRELLKDERFRLL
jgi:radical SAM superfamily enzyme YgiQ (UPF0313 family)